METKRTNNTVSVRKDLKSITEGLMQGLSDAAQKIADKALDRILQPIAISINKGEEVKIEGASHPVLPKVINVMNNRLPLFLVGEAGSGKTHLVEQAAKVLNLPFYCMSVCGQTTASSLLGYMNATGQYVRTLFRDAYEKGGVFLLDEIDNGNPNVLSVLNSALSNNVCSFPDTMVRRHKDFILCASGNTYGHGANRKYVGRLEIDGATLDRFIYIDVEYSKPLEKQICGWPEYAELIQAIRKKAQKLGMRHIISPRASIYGAKLIKSGMGLDEVLSYTVFKDMTKDDIAKIFQDDEENNANKLKEELKQKIQEVQGKGNNGEGKPEEEDGDNEDGQGDNGENEQPEGNSGEGNQAGKGEESGGVDELAPGEVQGLFK